MMHIIKKAYVLELIINKLTGKSTFTCISPVFKLLNGLVSKCLYNYQHRLNTLRLTSV